MCPDGSEWNSSRNILQSSAERARISSSSRPTGMGKYFLGPDGDLLRSITLCCSCSSRIPLGIFLSPALTVAFRCFLNLRK